MMQHRNMLLTVGTEDPVTPLTSTTLKVNYRIYVQFIGA